MILISLMRMDWCGYSLVVNPFAGLSERNINTNNVLPLPMEGDRHHLKVHHPALCLGDMNLNFQETQACKKIQV